MKCRICSADIQDRPNVQIISALGSIRVCPDCAARIEAARVTMKKGA